MVIKSQRKLRVGQLVLIIKDGDECYARWGKVYKLLDKLAFVRIGKEYRPYDVTDLATEAEVRVASFDTTIGRSI